MQHWFIPAATVLLHQVASDGTVTLKEWQENDIQREVQITVTTKSTTFYNAAKPVIVNLTVIKKKNLQQRIEDEKSNFLWEILEPCCKQLFRSDR